MVTQAQKVEFEVQPNELSALLTEAELIRTYQPPFNVALKDDKSPIYIYISGQEYSKVTQVRKQDIIHHQLKGTLLGPFASGQRAKEVLKIARYIFPWCEKPDPKFEKPCFYYHLGQCPGACVGEISVHEYQNQIKQLVLFLRGKSKQVQKELNTQMKKLAEDQKFEKAAKLRDQLQTIENITSQPRSLKPDLSTPGLIGKWHQDGTAYLKRLLTLYGAFPDSYQLNRIEGYDVSNLEGKAAAVSMVVFENGIKTPKEYRLFNIRTLQTPNDYQMLKEAISRRSKHQEWQIPDLLIIDGGRGQLKAALSVWPYMTPIISIAKNPDRIIIPVLDGASRKPINYHEVKLPPNHPGLQLVQAVRDESHRFAKKQHQKLRIKPWLKN